MILDRAQIEVLIPHAGAMCLLDGVLAWNATSIHARSASHRAADHPLRRDGRLHAVHLCEYGAQAMAVHGGLLAACRAYGIESENASARGQVFADAPADSGSIGQEAAEAWAAQADLQPILHKPDRLLVPGRAAMARPGMLVALRAVELAVERIDGLAGDLDVYAECIASGAQAWQYTFRVAHEGIQLACGRAMVALDPLR